MKKISILRITLMLASLTLVASCSGLINKFAFYPDRKTLIPESSLPSCVQLINIMTSDRVKLEALYFSHGSLTAKSRLLIYFHGNAGNMYHRMEEANRLYEMGVDVLIVSYRGYAGSQGKTTEAGVYKDGRSTLDYTQKVLGYKSGNIIVYGRSIGTAVAVDAAQNQNTLGLILITPLTSGTDMARKMNVGSAEIFAGKSFDSIGKINNIRSPLLIVHGTGDEVIPFSQGKKIFDAYDGKKTFVAIEGGGHNNLEFIDQRLYFDSINNFIAENTVR